MNGTIIDRLYAHCTTLREVLAMNDAINCLYFAPRPPEAGIPEPVESPREAAKKDENNCCTP